MNYRTRLWKFCVLMTFDEINPFIPDHEVEAKDTLLIDSCNYIILNDTKQKK